MDQDYANAMTDQTDDAQPSRRSTRGVNHARGNVKHSLDTIRHALHTFNPVFRRLPRRSPVPVQIPLSLNFKPSVCGQP